MLALRSRFRLSRSSPPGGRPLTCSSRLGRSGAYRQANARLGPGSAALSEDGQGFGCIDRGPARQRYFARGR